MFKYLNIVVGICLVASSALGADRLMKINKPQDLGELTVEESWLPGQTFEIRENFSKNRKKYFKFKPTIDIWKSDSVSVPLSLKINNFDIPKVRLTLKTTF
jgi:hypothetical protein